MEKFRELEAEDFRILLAVEKGMKTYGYVPTNKIVGYSGLPKEEATYRISRVHKLRLVRRITVPYEGYSLNYMGYDFLALNFFVRSGFLSAVGNCLGLGKEADVYEALTPKNEEVALKFHRLGRISFRQTAKFRDYTKQKTFWIFRSKAAAEKEYEALKRLYSCEVSVPKPVAQNRHAVLMGKILGVQLNELKSIENPEKVFLNILKNVQKAYVKAKIIHTDLSEYNVLVTEEEEVQIIDWPQYVTLNHPQAEILLRRDIENLAKYFWRRFKLKVSVENSLSLIKAGGKIRKAQIFL